MKDRITRREFMMEISLLGSILAGAGSLIYGCKKSNRMEENGIKKTKEADPCADLSGLTEDEKKTRTDFEYVAESPYSDKLCNNCALWIEAEEGRPCGGCSIMAGPIHPKGYCSAWVSVE